MKLKGYLGNGEDGRKLFYHKDTKTEELLSPKAF